MRAIEAESDAGVPLARLVEALGPGYLQLVHDPGRTVNVREVVIVEPGDEPETFAEDLVCVVGARSDAALPVLRALSPSGATVAVKGVPDDSRKLISAAEAAGTALLLVHPDMQWEQLMTMVRDIIGMAPGRRTQNPIDLFTLAQTISGIASGPVSIEDNDFRVLAYSTQGDEVDDFRRLSILGRQGPRAYLDKLAELGVYQRLHAGEDIVVVPEHPGLGIKPRIAVGIHTAGAMWGAIWIQVDGVKIVPDEERAALLGAARLVGQMIVQQRNVQAGPSLLFDSILSALIDGRHDGAEFGAAVGLSLDRPAIVAAVALQVDGADGRRMHTQNVRSAVANLVAVYAESYRRTVMMTSRHGAIVIAVLNAAEADARWLADMVGKLQPKVTERVHARMTMAIGPLVPTSAEIQRSYRTAVAALSVLARRPDESVVVADDVRSELLLAATIAELSAAGSMRHQPVEDLINLHPVLAVTLREYLCNGGHFAAVAARQSTHVNTVRYRVRRAAELAGLDLDNHEHVLVAELVLRVRLPAEANDVLRDERE
ncbi:helix-turn-helix domain-containing protein [Saxibacter everestensis]|uniref:Helix-turn-helix domain-containing protein n=1 Tax=Saxibacter everestensis TaxID=2909229 RepID=A0ABY8QPH2_9MICO|nr:helix-turn-helix domain-containing protein [Brevibacteriaceae bacterium ZFBP1038]